MIEADNALVTVSVAFGNEKEASAVASALVEGRLAACAQVWPIRSTYRWERRVEGANEFLLSAKTVASALPALEALVLSRHSYEVPEIVAQPVHWVTRSYADWVRESVSGRAVRGSAP
jgi:periplasmic divalent cation tolerance protein